jgi:hypothetical protein
VVRDIAASPRTVSNKAPPSARRASTAPAPTAALDQSNPPSVLAAGSETSGGSPLGDESPEALRELCSLMGDAVALTGIASAQTASVDTPTMSARPTCRAVCLRLDLAVMVGALSVGLLALWPRAGPSTKRLGSG